jgi:hypothetical protein
VVVDDRYPEDDEIRQVILEAMKEAGIKGNKLSEENKKQIDIYFSHFLPPGKKNGCLKILKGILTQFLLFEWIGPVSA